MTKAIYFSLISVIIVSLISFIGVFSLIIKKQKLNDFLIYLVSFSAGALFGDVFFHLLPEITEKYGFGLTISNPLLLGIVFSFLLEKIICWRHCHLLITKNHVHRFAYMNLWGDFFHNFLDGLTIAVSYLINIPTGIATTLAVIFHEIPQEIGDFGILLYGGFTIKKALIYNFLSGLAAILGAILSLILNNQVENVIAYLVPFAAGNFIYIAGSDLIPELHKEIEFKKAFWQITTFATGLLIMYLLLFVGE